jgi:hypothetical protein
MSKNCQRCWFCGETSTAGYLLQGLTDRYGPARGALLQKIIDRYGPAKRIQVCTNDDGIKEFSMKRRYAMPGLGVMQGPHYHDKDRTRIGVFKRVGEIEEKDANVQCQTLMMEID